MEGWEERVSTASLQLFFWMHTSAQKALHKGPVGAVEAQRPLHETSPVLLIGHQRHS